MPLTDTSTHSATRLARAGGWQIAQINVELFRDRQYRVPLHQWQGLACCGSSHEASGISRLVNSGKEASLSSRASLRGFRGGDCPGVGGVTPASPLVTAPFRSSSRATGVWAAMAGVTLVTLSSAIFRTVIDRLRAARENATLTPTARRFGARRPRVLERA